MSGLSRSSGLTRLSRISRSAVDALHACFRVTHAGGGSGRRRGRDFFQIPPVSVQCSAPPHFLPDSSVAWCREWGRCRRGWGRCRRLGPTAWSPRGVVEQLNARVLKTDSALLVEPAQSLLEGLLGRRQTPAESLSGRAVADSDESGHLFQSMSDTIPILSDSCRSEATL